MYNFCVSHKLLCIWPQTPLLSAGVDKYTLDNADKMIGVQTISKYSGQYFGQSLGYIQDFVVLTDF